MCHLLIKKNVCERFPLRLSTLTIIPSLGASNLF